MNNKRKFKMFLVLALVIALLLGGTYALVTLSDISKRNQANAGSFDAEIDLVDDYTPPDNWVVGEQIQSKVYVRYLEDGGKNTLRNSEPIVVRVQMSEYLQNVYPKFELSEKNYVTYSSDAQVEEAIANGWDDEEHAGIGEFVRFVGDAQISAMAKYEQSRFFDNVSSANVLGYAADNEIKAFSDDKSLDIVYVLAPTKADLDNLDENGQIDGQLGKQITLGKYFIDVVGKDTVDLETGKGYRFDKANFINYFPAESYPDSASKTFRDYVHLKFNDTASDGIHFMTKEDYFANYSDEERKNLKTWVYVVDKEGNPWLYWNQIMAPGDETAPILDYVELKQALLGKFLYLHNFKAQSASYYDDAYKNKNDDENLSGGTWDISIIDGLSQ